MISNYYNDEDEVFIEKVVGIKQGKYIYGKPELLHCFISTSTKVFRNDLNEQVYTSASYTSDTKIEKNDKINGQTVLQVDNPKGFSDKYYRAYV